MVSKSEKRYVLEEYVQELLNLEIPSQCLVRNYRITDGQKMKFVKLYRNDLFHGKDTSEERKALVAKIKSGKIEQFPKLLTPQMRIAKICADVFVQHMGMYFLAEKIAIHKMAEDFEDPDIEISDLWYNLKEIQKIINFEQRLNQHDWNYVIGYALASRMYQHYLDDPDKVAQDIHNMVKRKGSLGQVFNKYDINVNDQELIKALKREEKILTLTNH